MSNLTRTEQVAQYAHDVMLLRPARPHDVANYLRLAHQNRRWSLADAQAVRAEALR
jgi:hypothetical protein